MLYNEHFNTWIKMFDNRLKNIIGISILVSGRKHLSISICIDYWVTNFFICKKSDIFTPSKII